MDAQLGSPVHPNRTAETPGHGGGSVRPSGRVGAVLCLFLLSASLTGFAGCAAQSPRKATMGTRSSAERATRSGDWAAAADTWYAIFLNGGSSQVEPCVETARALIELGDAQSASSIVKVGLENHPDDPLLLEMMGEALAASGFRRAAEGWYERALARDPDCASCLRGLARQRMALGKESAAVRPLERLVALDEADYEVQLLLARSRTASGDLVGAFDAWSRAFELGHGELEDRLAAAVLYTDGRVRRAHPGAAAKCAGWLSESIARDPQCTRAHFLLGVLRERLGELGRAETSYRRAVETDPACLMALTNLAILYSTQGDLAKTQATVDRALALETDEHRRRALARLLEDCAQTGEGKGESDSEP